MKLIIDFKLLDKYNISPHELIEWYYTYISDNNNLGEKSIKILESFLIDNKPEKKLSLRKLNEDIDEKTELFRDKFKGLKLGSMGAPKSCKEKLLRWMKDNPKYNFDEILKACDIYIESLRNDYRFLQRADYFIYKKEGKEESSRLSAFIDEINNNNVQDWTTKLN